MEMIFNLKSWFNKQDSELDLLADFRGPTAFAKGTDFSFYH